MPQDTRVGGGGGYGRIQLPNTSRYARCSRATESRTPYPENSSGLLSRNRAGQCLFRTGCTGHRSLIDRAASCIDQRPNQRCQRHDAAAAARHRVAPADASARFWWPRRMVHLAAVPSRGRAPLGASSAARSAHLAAAPFIEQNGRTPNLRNRCSRVSQCCQSYPTATTSRRETTRQPPNTRVTRVRKNPGQ
jgi:hypothetical protein